MMHSVMILWGKEQVPVEYEFLSEATLEKFLESLDEVEGAGIEVHIAEVMDVPGAPALFECC